ncbi:MAG: class I SAM-dependent methyltransferase [Planctomycetota bacterium]|nr:class I SAM-dependent methyltransferase [Planctomycetota bacterium]
MTLRERLKFYDSPEGAEEYLDEYVKVHRRLSDRRERRILARWFEGMGALDVAIDLPCGFGRYYGFLRAHARRVIEADYSRDMVKATQARNEASPPSGFRCFGHEIPLRDGAVDLAFSMRLSHHLVDPEIRRAHLRELCRVSGRWVVFSFFDHASVKNLLRRARTSVGLTRKPPKSTLRRAEVRALAQECGFRVVEDPWLFVIGSGHRLVLGERVR